MTSVAAKVFACLLAMSSCGTAGDVFATDVGATTLSTKANNILDATRRLLAGALFQAIENDNVNQVKLLLAKGADPNYGGPDGRCGPLWNSFDANLTIVRSLLVAGANPNCVWADKSGGEDQSLSTPLMAAASMKGLRNVGRGGRMAWTNRPARKDMPQPADVIKLLLEFGAKPNTQSFFGTNALYDAIDADDVDAARALIDGGLDINSTIDTSMPGEVQPWYRGQTALMHALGRYDLKNIHAGLRMIGMLLQRGANPNVLPYGRFIADCGQGTPPCSFSGETPLSYEARLGYTAYAQLLLEHGAKPDAARADGARPKDIAVKAGNLETAKVIGRYEK